MMTFMKKAVLVGVGIAGRARTVLDDLSKEGDANRSKGAQRVKAFFDQGEQIEGECKQKMGDLLQRAKQCCSVPSQSDIERLEKGLADLASEVRRRA